MPGTPSCRAYEVAAVSASRHILTMPCGRAVQAACGTALPVRSYRAADPWPVFIR
jgi:hypothetical protein